MFGFMKKKPASVPSYLMFITDGDTDQTDQRTAEALLKEMASSNIYIQLIGVGRGARFTFLKDMADKYDHVGFVTFPDLDRVTDDQMYEQLLSEEACEWMKTR